MAAKVTFRSCKKQQRNWCGDESLTSLKRLPVQTVALITGATALALGVFSARAATSSTPAHSFQVDELEAIRRTAYDTLRDRWHSPYRWPRRVVGTVLERNLGRPPLVRWSLSQLPGASEGAEVKRLVVKFQESGLTGISLDNFRHVANGLKVSLITMTHLVKGA